MEKIVDQLKTIVKPKYPIDVEGRVYDFGAVPADMVPPGIILLENEAKANFAHAMGAIEETLFLSVIFALSYAGDDPTSQAEIFKCCIQAALPPEMDFAAPQYQHADPVIPIESQANTMGSFQLRLREVQNTLNAGVTESGEVFGVITYSLTFERAVHSPYHCP